MCVWNLDSEWKEAPDVGQRKDFCLCPKSPGWEMSFVEFQAESDDQFCSAKGSLWKREGHRGVVAVVWVGEGCPG